MLGIPFYVWDLSDRFAADVVDDFVAEYAAGRTPNPCLRCNEKIKFSAVLDRGVALGFDAVCTGHYARLIRTGDDVELHRAVDASKDQSYVLAVLNQHQLRRCYFPLGATRKIDVRAEARIAAWQSRKSLTVTTSASLQTGTQPDSWSSGSATGWATSWTWQARRLASIEARTVHRSGSGVVYGWARQLLMASRASCWPSRQRPTPSRSVREMRWRWVA